MTERELWAFRQGEETRFDLDKAPLSIRPLVTRSHPADLRSPFQSYRSRAQSINDESIKRLRWEGPTSVGGRAISYTTQRPASQIESDL